MCASQSFQTAFSQALVPVQEPALDGFRILFVEGEAFRVDLLPFTLRKAGAEVVTATHAHQALKQRMLRQFDVLLCNVRLPVHQATWLIQQIRSQESVQEFLPAIAMTSYMRETSGKALLEAGFQRYMLKPAGVDEFIAEIREMVMNAVSPISF